MGLPGSFLTDHGVVCGLLPFAEEMRRHDLFAGFGVEAYMAPTTRKEVEKRSSKNRDVDIKRKVDNFHLILLAKSPEGYKNLLRLSDEAARSGQPSGLYPRVDWELLERYKEGIACTSACMGGLVAQHILNEEDPYPLIQKFQRLFKDDFFLEIHTYESKDQTFVNHVLQEAAKDLSIRPLVAVDSHYARPDDYLFQELLLSINQAEKLRIHHPPCLYIMGEDEVRKRLQEQGLNESFIDEAIANTEVLRGQCEFDLPEIRQHLPVFFSGQDIPNDEVFFRLASNGLESRLEAIPPEKHAAYWERLEYEYNALDESGLSDYFLIVSDFISWAKRQRILMSPSRGSVGGSLIAYALGITEIDPIKYGLYFERFWNPGRAKGLPDIDVDFENARRNEVKEYLAKKYGAENVLGIGNHIVHRSQASIRSVGMSLGIPFPVIDAINTILKKTTDSGLLASWEEILSPEGSVLSELQPYLDEYPELFEAAQALDGRVARYGAHASAVVVSDVPLHDHLPCMKKKGDSGEAEFVTQHEMRSVEALGFAKMDLLGLRTLDVLALVLEMVGEKDYAFFNKVDYESLPDEFWENLWTGRTLGLFQIEDGGGAKRVVQALKPHSIAELGLSIAVNRPGPGAAALKQIVECRVEGKSPSYKHPLLESVLESTFGAFVYQEQILAYLNAIGYSLSDADHVRKIMGKKKIDELEAEYERYLPIATEILGETLAQELWQDIMPFSHYGFNISHAIGYGTLLAWTMYAKWRWPTEFVVASVRIFREKRGKFFREAKRLGIEVRLPNINTSQELIAKTGDNEITIGLSDIKFVKTAAQWILQNRPKGGYRSYDHFIRILDDAQKAWEKEEKITRGKSPKQTVRANVIKCLVNVGAFDSVCSRPMVSLKERAEYEKELLEVVLTDVYGEIKERNATKLVDLAEYADLESGSVCSVPGIIKDIRKTKVKKPGIYKGKDMALIDIEWEGEQTSFAVFCDQWEGMSAFVQEEQLGIFTLKATHRGNSMAKAVILH